MKTVKYFLCVLAFFFIGCTHKTENSVKIDHQAVLITIRNSLNQFKACYTTELKKDSTLKGTVVLKWQILEDGSPTHVGVLEEKTTLKNQTVQQCLMTEMTQLKFPKPLSHSIGEVTFPFVFLIDEKVKR